MDGAFLLEERAEIGSERGKTAQQHNRQVARFWHRENKRRRIEGEQETSS